MPELIRKKKAEEELERIEEELQECFDTNSIWLYQWELRQVRYPATAVSEESVQKVSRATNESEISEAFKALVNESAFDLLRSRNVKKVLEFDQLQQEVFDAANLIEEHSHLVTSLLLYKGFRVGQTKFEIIDDQVDPSPMVKVRESKVINGPPKRVPVNHVVKKLDFDMLSESSEEDKSSTPLPSFNTSSIKPTPTTVGTNLNTTMEYILQGVADGKVPVDDVAQLLKSFSMSDSRNNSLPQETKNSSKPTNQVIAVMKKEPGQFHGDFDAPEKAKRWLRELKEVGEFQNWSDNQYRLMFKQRLTGHAINWYKQLDEDVRKDWSELQAIFKEKYCAGSESKRQKYYRMSQGQLSAINYLYALNAAARKAYIDYNGDKFDREEHFKQYCDTLNDKTLADSLRLREYATMQQLEAAVERWERGQKKPKFNSEKKFRGSGNPSTRVQFLDVEEEKFESSQKSSSMETIIQAVLDKLPSSRIQSTQTIQNSQIRSPNSGKFSHKSGNDSKVHCCSHCKKTGHTVENCFQLKKCKYCGEKGHSDRYCLTRARKIITMHENAANNPKVMAALPDDMVQELKD